MNENRKILASLTKKTNPNEKSVPDLLRIPDENSEPGWARTPYEISEPDGKSETTVF